MALVQRQGESGETSNDVDKDSTASSCLKLSFLKMNLKQY